MNNAPETTLDNLDRLSAALNGLTSDEKDRLVSMLVGALSADVDDATWSRALDLAMRCSGLAR